MKLKIFFIIFLSLSFLAFGSYHEAAQPLPPTTDNDKEGIEEASSISCLEKSRKSIMNNLESICKGYAMGPEMMMLMQNMGAVGTAGGSAADSATASGITQGTAGSINMTVAIACKNAIRACEEACDACQSLKDKLGKGETPDANEQSSCPGATEDNIGEPETIKSECGEYAQYANQSMMQGMLGLTGAAAAAMLAKNLKGGGGGSGPASPTALQTGGINSGGSGSLASNNSPAAFKAPAGGNLLPNTKAAPTNNKQVAKKDSGSNYKIGRGSLSTRGSSAATGGSVGGFGNTQPLLNAESTDDEDKSKSVSPAKIITGKYNSRRRALSASYPSSRSSGYRSSNRKRSKGISNKLKTAKGASIKRSLASSGSKHQNIFERMSTIIQSYCSKTDENCMYQNKRLKL